MVKGSPFADIESPVFVAGKQAGLNFDFQPQTNGR